MLLLMPASAAKSVGSMLEADLFMLWAAAFAVFGCLGSMATAVWLNRAGCELLSHTIVLTFWLAGSCGFLAFMKHRVNKPSFGSPCSMAALILSVVITKEGAVHLGNWEGGVILQLLWIIVIGTLISNLVCFLLFRGSATTLLQANVNKTLDSFATLLVMLTKAFLLEEDATISPERLQRATSAHEASFTSLKVAFDEAKLELLDPRIHRGVGLYDACIASMSRLAKHITGLREGCRSQDALLQERKAKRQDLEQTIITSSQTESQPEFEVFEQHVGPPLRSLIVTCKAALKEMRSVFVHSSAGQKEKASLANDSGRLQSLRDALKDDLQTFSVAHAVILKRLYREYPASTESSSFDASQAGDYVFTFYFFLHSLESLVRELDRLLQIFIRLHEVEVTLEHRRDIFVKRFGTYLGSFIFGLDFWNDGKGVHSQPQRWKQFRARLWKLNPLTTSDNLFRDVIQVVNTYTSR